MNRHSEKMQPEVDVIVLNYNSGDLLRRTLPTVLETKYPEYNVIVVDNGSNDQSVDWVVDTFGDRVKLIKLDKNYGCAGGLNRAIPYINGKYVALLNEDIIPDKNWLTEAVNILEKTPKAGMVLSSLIKPDKKTIEGTSGWFSKKYCIFGQNKTDIEKDTLTTHAGMGSVLVRSDLLREFKIEEKYFLYYEGIDLSLRMWLSGYEIVACPKSILYHFHRGSVNRNFKNHEIDRLVVRNNLLVFLRFYPLKWILLYMPTYLWDRGIIFSGRLMRRELLRAIAIPMGLIDGILEWKWIIQMRSKTPNKERIEEVLNKLDKLGVKEKCAWRIGL